LLGSWIVKLTIMTLKFGVLFVFSIGILSGSCGRLKEKFSWKELDFAWPSAEAKDEAVKSGNYIEKNNLPLGLEVWKNKLFITVPR
jgi:hypothetical protein